MWRIQLALIKTAIKYTTYEIPTKQILSFITIIICSLMMDTSKIQVQSKYSFSI